MPIYAYRCSKCGEEVEVMQSMTDPPLKRCKKCKGALRRVYHPVGIAFKGSGFYKTDSGRAGKRSDDKRSDDKRSDDKRSDDKRSDDKKSEVKKSDDKKSATPTESKTGSSSD